MPLPTSIPEPPPANEASRYRRNALQRGFTLIELLVVLAILGLIAAFVTPQVLNYLARAKVEAAHIQAENIASALDLFKLDVGRYPTQAEGLAALVKKPVGLPSWNGPYLKERNVPLDPWGRPYVYKIPGDHSAYELYSRGPDGDAGDNGQTQDAEAR